MHEKFSLTLALGSKVRDVQSSDMPKFGYSKFNFFEFVPTLTCAMAQAHLREGPRLELSSGLL